MEKISSISDMKSFLHAYISVPSGLEIPMETGMSNHSSESASYHSTTIFTIEDDTLKKNVRNFVFLFQCVSN